MHETIPDEVSPEKAKEDLKLNLKERLRILDEGAKMVPTTFSEKRKREKYRKIAKKLRKQLKKNDLL